MPHCDDETLSLLALGEPASALAEEHLEACSHCTGELASLRRVVAAARDEAPPVPLTVQPVVPPARVWDQIAAATGVQASPRPEEVLRHASTPVTSTDALPLDLEPGLPPDPQAEPETPADSTNPADQARRPVRIPQQPRKDEPRRRPARSVLAVAAASLIIGLLGGGFGTWLITGRSEPAPAPVVVAATKLVGLPLAPGAVGQADVIQTSRGRQLDLDVQRLGRPDGFYEVWLIDPTVTKMVAIGVLSGSEGSFSLPDGVNLSSYPLIDISVQPLNGDPKHSGQSVLRGTFKL